MDILTILLASLTIMFASLIGVFSMWRHLGSFIERHLAVLVSFSAGVFLIVSYELATEVLEHTAHISAGLIWMLVGALGIFILSRFLPAFHHHHDDQCEPHTHSPIDARRVLAGDAIHNVADGILLASAFAISMPLGIITAASVFIHELVQEASEFFVLRQAGYSAPRALLVNFMVSSTILIGALGGFLLLDTFVILETPLLGMAAGAFFAVVVYDLIPQSVRSSHTQKQYGRHIVWFSIGVALMFSVSALAAHAHSEEEEHDHDDGHELHDIEISDNHTHEIHDEHPHK